MIPRIIVQYWNSEIIPADVKPLISSWSKFNPEFKHIVFTEEQAASFIKVKFGPEAQELFLSAALPAMQSDIFRVAFCLGNGGFYIDVGTQCLGSILSILPSDNKLALMRKWHGGIWNGMIACKPNHPALEAIWNKILHNLRSQSSGDVWEVTGPLSFNQINNDKIYAPNIAVIDQKDIKSFKLIGELEYRKEHWSEVQKNQSIFK